MRLKKCAERSRKNKVQRPIVICGAGVAGLSLGIKLRLLGLDPILLEKDAGVKPFIRGEYFQPGSIQKLKELGVYSRLLERNAIRIDRVSHLYRNLFGNKVRRFVAFLGDLGPGIHGLSVLHEDILRVFRDRYEELGGRLSDSTSVSGLSLNPHSCTVEVGTEKVEAQLFLGCDGKAGVTRKLANIPSHSVKVDSQTRVMIAGLVKGLRIAKNEFLTAETPAGVLYAFHCNRGDIRVYLCVSKSRYDHLKSDLKQNFLACLQSSIIPGSADAALTAPLWVMPSMDRMATARAKMRAVWLGDAAGTVDPLCGHGMNLAIQHACKLAELISQNGSALECETDSMEWLAQIKKFDRATRRDYLHTRFMGIWVANLFMQDSKWFRLAKKRAISRYQKDARLLNHLMGLFAGMNKDSFGFQDLPYLLGILGSRRRDQIMSLPLVQKSAPIQNALLTTPIPLFKYLFKSRFDLKTE